MTRLKSKDLTFKSGNVLVSNLILFHCNQMQDAIIFIFISIVNNESESSLRFIPFSGEYVCKRHSWCSFIQRQVYLDVV